MTADSKLLILLGLSGSGKTTALRYLETSYEIETAPKYTTRKSRGTVEDDRDFIFCTMEDYPSGEVITFETYGQKFGIQHRRIGASMDVGLSHAVIVGTEEAVRCLEESFPSKVVVILIHATLAEIERRISADPARLSRLPEIRREAAGFYDSLACVQFVVSTNGGVEAAFRSLDRIVSILGISRREPSGESH